MVFDECFRDVSATPAFQIYPKREVRNGRARRRLIHEPNDAMRTVHSRLIQVIRRQQSLPRQLFVSPAENVGPHRGNRYFYKVDLRDAFGSVRLERMVQALHLLNKAWYRDLDEIGKFLQQYCFSARGGLATGAPASPILFEIYAATFLDKPLTRVIHSYWSMGDVVVYTRFVDDLTFSSVNWEIGLKRRRRIRDVIHEAGFSLNHRKAQVRDLAKGPVVVTGIGMTKEGLNPKVFLPRRKLATIRGMLRKALRGGDVPRSEIEGMMSVFWMPWGRKDEMGVRLNRTERKVLLLYWEYRRRFSSSS